MPPVSRRYSRLIALTGLTPAALATLTTRTAAAQPAATGRPWRLALPDPVLLVAAGLRTNLTTRALAAVFSISQSMTVRIQRHLLPLPADLPQTRAHPSHGRRCTRVLDGTLIPVHDQSRTAVSNNYRRSVNVQLVIRRCDRAVIAASTAWPGNRNDIIIARAQHDILLAEPPRQILADGGYHSLPGVIGPIRDPHGRIIRDEAWRRHRRRRATVEHIIARLKDWQILRQCHRPGRGIDLAVAAVTAIYNHRLDHLRLNS